MARLPKSIIKKYGISKKAWAVFRGRSGRSLSSRKARHHSSGGKISMAKRRVRHWYSRRRRPSRRGFSIQRTAFTVVRVGALVAPGIDQYLLASGPPLNKAARAIAMYGGYNMDNQQFDAGILARMWTPFLGVSLATYGIPKLIGMIRRL